MAVLPPPMTRPFADFGDMAEDHRRQPFDPDMDHGAPFLAARQVGQVAAARGAGADEDRIVAFGQHFLHAGDPVVEIGGDPHVEDVVDLFVQDRFRQTEGGHLAAHEAAACVLVVVEIDLVAERHQITGHGQGGRTAADQGDFFAVFLAGDFGKEARHVIRLSAQTRFRRQMATGSFSTRPRRQAGSQGRSQIRPSTPGKTLDTQLSI